jgi:hypothetical protein
MGNNTTILAVLAFIIVAVATPFELFGVPLAPIAALIFGAIAGWMVAGTRRSDTGAAGARAGALVGVGALLGSIVGLAVLALWIGNIPEVQTFVQNSEPHPEARIPADWIAPLGALAGVVVGLVVGLFDLIIAAIAGWIAGALHTQSQTHA